VTCTWQSTHHVEVPASWEHNGQLGDLLDAMQQINPDEDVTAETAELVDWEVHG
jgi:hypothetical protein